MNIATDNSTYYIMFQNKPVVKVDMGKGEITYREDLCPYNLSLIDSPQNFNEQCQNLVAFTKWCSGRIRFMERKYAPQLCNCLNIPMNEDIKFLADIAITYSCSTLWDAWWIKKKDSDVYYQDISLFKNRNENLLTVVSLFGELVRTNTNLSNWADLTVGGFSPKSWVYEKGSIYLYKNSKNTIGEVAASKVLSSMGVNVVPYEQVTIRNTLFTKSPCFTSESVSFIPCSDLLKREGIYVMDKVKKTYIKEYANMVVAFYLVGNMDLSDKSWGLLMSNKSGKIMGIAPLFGFEKCFLKYDALSNFVIHELAVNYAAYSDIDYDKADLSVIPEHFRDVFRFRCEEMQKIRDKTKMQG